MLLEVEGRRGLATKGFTIIILWRSSHGEITPIGTYVDQGLGPSWANRRRLYHNHLMEVYRKYFFMKIEKILLFKVRRESFPSLPTWACLG